MGRKLGECTGDVLDTDIFEIQGKGSCVKARVNIEMQKPLLTVSCTDSTDEDNGDRRFSPWLKTFQSVRRVKSEPAHVKQERDEKKVRKKQIALDLLEKLHNLKVDEVQEKSSPKMNFEKNNMPKEAEDTCSNTQITCLKAAIPEEPPTRESPTLKHSSVLTDCSNLVHTSKKDGKTWKRIRTEHPGGGNKENFVFDNLLTKRKADMDIDPVDVRCSGEGRTRVGGLELFWNNDITDILSTSANHIDDMVSLDDGETSWRCTGIYDFPESDRKHMTWDLLRF
ncbi:hypothetical protein SESBI_25263 [Sesbania bispinosa]|nr:hypothetical protein SESBI_25263 [Sesbania bispinosa]